MKFLEICKKPQGKKKKKDIKKTIQTIIMNYILFYINIFYTKKSRHTSKTNNSYALYSLEHLFCLYSLNKGSNYSTFLYYLGSVEVMDLFGKKVRAMAFPLKVLY